MGTPRDKAKATIQSIASGAGEVGPPVPDLSPQVTDGAADVPVADGAVAHAMPGPRDQAAVAAAKRALLDLGPTEVSRIKAQRRKQRPNIRAALDALRRAKAESDRGNYPAKHDIMKKLIEEDPDSFVIDSQLHRFYGVTHEPTNFRMHLPPTALPATLRRTA